MSNQLHNLEVVRAKFKEWNEKVDSGEIVIKRPTLESLQAQLDSGEITQEEFDHSVMWYQLTPEAVAESVRETREKMRDAKFRDLSHYMI
jgi:type IV secretory pathway VirB4 component